MVNAMYESLALDLSAVELPNYIAIEGPIGVGKTTLAQNLAQLFHYDLLLEKPEQNPFLARFYQEPKSVALQTQLFFLFQRAGQIQQLRQDDMFSPRRIADFMLEKDPLFAQVTLDAPRPDLVIYLQAPLDVLQARVKQRGNEFEQHISDDYLKVLNEAYTSFFHYYDSAPLLIVNAQDLNLAQNRDHFQHLVEYITTIKSGRHYYNPTPAL